MTFPYTYNIPLIMVDGKEIGSIKDYEMTFCFGEDPNIVRIVKLDQDYEL